MRSGQYAYNGHFHTFQIAIFLDFIGGRLLENMTKVPEFFLSIKHFVYLFVFINGKARNNFATHLKDVYGTQRGKETLPYVSY